MKIPLGSYVLYKIDNNAIMCILFLPAGKICCKELNCMYFVPDGTDKCGFYECKECSYRFLSLNTEKKISCPLCEQDMDYEIGPDESLEDLLFTADLQDIIEGEDVERMDMLLSAAYSDDGSWI